MELADNLILNENALTKLPNDKRPVFIYEWLRFLDKVLPVANKGDIKEKQEHILKILLNQLEKAPGPPTRKLIACNLGTLFSVGDTFSLHLSINMCNDLVKNRDDSPSYLPTRLAAIAALGELYRRLGRMVGRSYEETVSVLLRALKQGESQTRCETMLTLEQVVGGLGSAGSGCHKDILKATKTCLMDRSMVVRSAACKCLLALVISSASLQTTDLDSTVAMCLRALEDSDYSVRCEMAKVLGRLLAGTQAASASPGSSTSKPTKMITLDDIFAMLGQGFVKSATSLFKPAANDSIRSGGVLNSEVRVGVTHAIVEFGKCMGTAWLERNLSPFINKVLGLVSNSKATPVHVEAVYARKCVNFILRTLISLLLSDGGKMLVGRELCEVIRHTMTNWKVNVKPATGRDSPIDDSGKAYSSSSNDNSQHVLICALQELSCLVQELNTAAATLLDSPTNIVDTIMPVLLHPSNGAQLSAAFCLRCLVEAIPSQLTPVLDKCLSKLEVYKSHPEAVLGYSYAISALLSSVSRLNPSVCDKGQQIMSKAEEMVLLVNQPNSRLALARTHAVWFLIGSCCNLGPSFIKSQLGRLLLLWRNAFPKINQDVDSEKQRGDSFTWHVTLESRSGALCSMQSFVENCGSELLSEEVLRRILPILDCALATLSQIPSIVRTFGTTLKAPAALMRLRLYNLLLLLPLQAYHIILDPSRSRSRKRKSMYNTLLRELVAEFTLTENPANITTSLLRSMCHADDSVILGSWLQETDHKYIEDQLQPNSANGSGAMEHDPSVLFLSVTTSSKARGIVAYPVPLPLGVAVIDASVQLFGLIFPKVQSKHRLQILEHFSECIRQAKSVRQQATQMNIFTAVLCAMRRLAETKSLFGTEHNLKKEAVALIFGSLVNQNPILRCAAGECLGRMAQVIGDSGFIAEMAQYSFDRLKGVRDVVNRTGYSLALGCLHRYVGSLSSGQHLNTSVGILLALAQDASSPVVQVWALHALALIADSGGPMFRDYLELTMNLVLSLLLQTSPSLIDVHQCLGKVLGALITTLGPELQGGSVTIESLRMSCTVSCSILQGHPDSLVQAEAVSCLQQLHMFAPKHVNLSSLIPHLYKGLSSPHLLLRRSVVACLRQLSQKEDPVELAEVVSQMLQSTDRTVSAKSHFPKIGSPSISRASCDPTLADVLDAALQSQGLEGAFFQLLDFEQDPKLCSDLEDTILCLLQSQGEQQLSKWLQMLKEVIQAGKAENRDPRHERDLKGDILSKEKDEDIEDDDIEINANKDDGVKPFNGCRWPTKVFAVECFRKILQMCVSSKNKDRHFNIVHARSFKAATDRSDCLILHLSDLITFSFIAATTEIDKLRLVGLGALQDIINLFATVAEPEYPDQVILEQYQAQVGAALRPAFSAGTCAEIRAAACEVCSTWIASGVARDLNDLRRVHQLLVNCLDKLQCENSSQVLSSIEGLAVLRAWAEIYVVAVSNPNMRDLMGLVDPVLVTLSDHWWQTLHTYAILSLPPDLAEALQQKTSSSQPSLFHTVESADLVHRLQYQAHWHVILYAASLWLVSQTSHPSSEDKVFLLLGLSMDAMCGLVSKQPDETIKYCLKTCTSLLSQPSLRSLISKNLVVPIELLNVIHRTMLTRDCGDIHLQSLNLLSLVVNAVQEKRLANSPSTDPPADGNLTRCPVFATMEVIICGLTRYVPHLLDDVSHAPDSTNRNRCTVLPLVATSNHLKSLQVLTQLVASMSKVLEICDRDQIDGILPSLLHLCNRLIQLEVYKQSRSHSQLDKSRCSNDTSPWTNRFPENIADSIVQFYDSLEPFLHDSGSSERVRMVSCSLLLLLTSEESASSLPLYLVTSIMKKISRSVLRDNQTLQLRMVDSCQRVWHRASDGDRIPLLQSIYTLISLPDDFLMKYFARNLSELVISWLFKLPGSIDKANVTQDTIRLFCMSADYFEVLVDVVHEDQKSSIIFTLLPLLIVILLPPDGYESASANRTSLHNQSLQRINSIAPRYPSEFRNFLSSASMAPLKSRLEEAARRAKFASQKQSLSASFVSAQKDSSETSKVPKIELKMNFSNFN